MRRKGRATQGAGGREDRPEEVRAQKLIAETLGLDVHLHDDGSANSMYDLRIGPGERPLAAIEVVGAVDFHVARTWRAGDARGPIAGTGKADWLLFLADGTVVERLRRKLGALIRRMESAGWHEQEGRHDVTANRKDRLAHDLHVAGVTAAYCTATPGNGIVRFGQNGEVGSSDHAGVTVGPWISAFLHHEERADVRGKLQASDAAERHVFVYVDFKGAPFATWNYLAGSIDSLPVSGPDLPPVVDQVWIWSGVTTRDRPALGIRWTGRAWATFPRS